MAARHLVIWNDATNKIGNVNVADTGIFAEDMVFAQDLTVGGLLNGRDITADGAKLDFISLTGPIDLDDIQMSLTAAEEVTDLLTVSVPVSLDAWKVKLDFITVTAPVDLDALSVGIRPNVVTVNGNWDPSTGEFPAATFAGQSYIAAYAGTVDSIDFEVGDRIIAKVNTPSTTLNSSWHIEGRNDDVKSVAGRKGEVVLVEADITDLQGYLLPEDLDSLAKLNLTVGDTVLTADSIDSFSELQALVSDAVIVDTVALNAAIAAQNGWRLLGGNLIGVATGSGTPALQAFGPSASVKRLRFGVGDSVYVAFTIPHDFEAGSDVIPVVQFATDGTEVTTVKWELRYNVTPPDGATSSDAVTYVEMAAQGTAWHNVIAASVLTFSGFEVGTMISMEIKRVTNGVTENTDDVFGLHAGFYYQADRIGTLNKTKPYYV